MPDGCRERLNGKPYYPAPGYTEAHFEHIAWEDCIVIGHFVQPRCRVELTEPPGLLPGEDDDA